MKAITIKATKAHPYTIEIFGKPYQFTATTTATRAATVAALLQDNHGVDHRFELAALLHETTLTGKLEGLRSLTTSCRDCSFCAHCATVKGFICGKCYAGAELKKCIRRTLNEHAIINGWILKHIEFTPEHMIAAPVARFQQFFRIESHGETESFLQAANYIALAKARPETTFGIWSKNIIAWKRAFNTYGKPKNIVFTFSSPMIDKPAQIPKDFQKYVDHRFTVYHGAGTCGHKCRDCIETGRNCYYHDTEFDITEGLK